MAYSVCKAAWQVDAAVALLLYIVAECIVYSQYMINIVSLWTMMIYWEPLL